MFGNPVFFLPLCVLTEAIKVCDTNEVKFSFKNYQPGGVRSDPAGSGPKNPVVPFQLPRSSHIKWTRGGSIWLGDCQLSLRELH